MDDEKMLTFTQLRSLLLIVLIFLVGPQTFAANTNDNTLPAPVGKVVWVKGTLHAIMPNKEERTLQKSSIIYLHDTLKTDPDSQAEIIFTDNSLMTFYPKTTFYIDQYSYRPKTGGGSVGKYVMRLIEGGFRTITGLIAKNNPTDYQVNTPVATIGVRGTEYAVYFRDGKMYIGYYKGSPCVFGQKEGVLCLNANTPFGVVPGVNAVPVPLTEQPGVFQQQLIITPATMTTFNAAPGTAVPLQSAPNGPITSFCITN
jgi:hypothetical protein